MHIERRENPFKNSERAESERDQRHFDKVVGGMSCFFLRCKMFAFTLLIFCDLKYITVCFFGPVCLQKNKSEGNPFHSVQGCQYTGVETLGKELFMYFGPRALR